MLKERFAHRKLTVVCAVLAITLIQSMGTSGSVCSRSLAATSAAVDIGPESRTLDTYVDELRAFDRKCALLNKKPTLTRAEFEPLQRDSDNLKRRLSEVQNTLRQIIAKLKAADQWNDLDAKVLASIRDSRDQADFRRSSFKRELEDASLQLTASQNEIGAPLDNLHRKVSAQVQNLVFDKELELRAVRVAYAPAPAMIKGLRCTLASIRFGISGFVRGEPTDEAKRGRACSCFPEEFPSCTNQAT